MTTHSGPINPPHETPPQTDSQTGSAEPIGSLVFSGPINPPSRTRQLLLSHATSVDLGSALVASAVLEANAFAPLHDRADVDALVQAANSQIAALQTLPEDQIVLLVGSSLRSPFDLNQALQTIGSWNHSDPELDLSGLQILGVAPFPSPLRKDSIRQEIEHLTNDAVIRRQQALEFSIEAYAPAWPFLRHLGLADLPAAGRGVVFTCALIDVVLDATLLPVMQMKRHLKVPRPDAPAWGSSAHKRPALKVPAHSSFPSGHAAQAHALAVVLANVTGHSPQVLKTLAATVAMRRETAGLHTPTDSSGGQVLGDLLGGKLVLLGRSGHLAHPDWTALYALASQEWRSP